MKRKSLCIVFGCLVAGLLGASRYLTVRLGRQSDGRFIVSTGQIIEGTSICFNGRPVDLAMHPTRDMAAVLGQKNVFLCKSTGVVPGSEAALGDGAGYHGIVWNPNGSRLLASVSNGTIQEFELSGDKLISSRTIDPGPGGMKGNARPGGLAITSDGRTLYACLCDRQSVARIDLDSGKFSAEYKVDNLPFEVQLTLDGKSLLVTNWGGRRPRAGDRSEDSLNVKLVADRRGSSASGTVSKIDLASERTETIEVGLHPTGMTQHNGKLYVACASSDSISVVDIDKWSVDREVAIKWGGEKRYGSMPCALAFFEKRLLVCNGGDNALCEVDPYRGKVLGFRPAGFYPIAIGLGKNSRAYVLNTKGNGSVRRTVKGQPGNAHDFQGSVTVLDLRDDLAQATKVVVSNNHWNQRLVKPNLKVYQGAIKNVLYIIKENRTYDEVFGDLPMGNGDKKLCGLGEEITPNHHALARQFTLFDNAYVSGTNSADGHNWTDGALANDYLEHFYTGYRTYPDDGDDVMGISPKGNLWDAALEKHKSVRIYGEWVDDDLARYDPPNTTWIDVWKERKAGTHNIKLHLASHVPAVQRCMNPDYPYWPLITCDQKRADIFIEEYGRLSAGDEVPNLMVMSLPCDHTEGLSPDYPKPRSMVADNDLGLGRIVEAVSHSPQWKETCIFVIEDDAQAGPDHVDGHRTVAMAISPYTRRGYVDSSFLTTCSILRSIEWMLGLDPMNRFDALATPFETCFTNRLDLSGYRAVVNRVPLDDMNKPKAKLSGEERYWAVKSESLDWSSPDAANWYWLNRIVWYSLHGRDQPYPN